MSLVKSIGKQKVNVDFNKDFINLFSEKIKKKDIAFINQTLEDLHAADVADLIENLDTELCLDNRPVEKLIQSLGTTTIIASVSTSMINLKLKFKDQVSCYYFGLNKYVSSQYRSYYQKVFQKLSIKHLRESCD